MCRCLITLTIGYMRSVSILHTRSPAMCLTQDLSSRQRADILLLGCGDVRNILFIKYSDSTFRLVNRIQEYLVDLISLVVTSRKMFQVCLLDAIEAKNDGPTSGAWRPSRKPWASSNF